MGGNGSAPAPHELLPAAVAACVSTTLVMYARTKKWPLDRVTVDVEYDPKARPPRCEVSIHVTGDLDAEQVARLDKVGAACPVRRAIEAGIEFEERLDVRSAPVVAA